MWGGIIRNQHIHAQNSERALCARIDPQTLKNGYIHAQIMRSLSTRGAPRSITALTLVMMTAMAALLSGVTGAAAGPSAAAGESSELCSDAY